jgi:hypothetical protein
MVRLVSRSLAEYNYDLTTVHRALCQSDTGEADP